MTPVDRTGHPSRHALSSAGYATDKSATYLGHYQRFIQHLRDEPITLLEIGIDKGGSLLMWRDYFTRGLIVGLDAERVTLSEDSRRVRIYQGRQEDTGLLDRIAREQAPQGFDVIIDDASHIGALTRLTFWHLFVNHLKPGGVFVIEDWGTGYWPRWPDGSAFTSPAWLLSPRPRPAAVDPSPGVSDAPAHTAGMVGFVKELVDECGMGDITKPGLGVPPSRASLFEVMQISPGQVFVVKAR